MSVKRQITACLVATALAAGCRSADPRPVSRFPYQDDISFRGFAEEALFGCGTPRTHLFDNYTKGSYHVRPWQVVQQLPEVAATYKLRLHAIAVVGPYGPLWAYDVITVVEEPACLRVNWLLMPHGRITVKRTGCVAPEAVREVVSALAELAPEGGEPSDGGSCLAVRNGEQVRWGPFDCYAGSEATQLDRLDEVLERLGRTLQVSYSNYPPVEEEEQ